MIAVIIPIWCQNKQTLDMLEGAADSWRQQQELVIYPTCNRLHGITPEELEASLTSISGKPVRVLYEPYVERTVAGAWNHGINTAINDGYTDFVITSQDVLWHPGAINRLVDFGRTCTNQIVSGVEQRQASSDTTVTEGADFSGLYLSMENIKQFGPFFEGYRPGYFEDNDYVANVWSKGGFTNQFHGAKFFHQGSGTIKLDAELAHHVSHWFGINKKLFCDRWGSEPVGTRAEAIGRYDFKRRTNEQTHQNQEV